MTAFNDRVIAEFRAQHGTVGGFGNRLVLIHSRGARSGAERVNPALSMRDHGSRLVIASAAGAVHNPAWYHNLVAHPNAAMEDDSGQVIPVTATELHGTEYDEAWTRFDAASPAFQQYQDQAGTRKLPILRLTPQPVAE